MKNYSVKQTSLCFLLATFLLSNTAAFSPVAGSDSTSSDSSQQPATDAGQTNANDANIPDDQLALPISLKQFQNLQEFVQKHTEENIKAIDELTKDSEEFTKNFNAFVDDLLKAPDAPAA